MKKLYITLKLFLIILLGCNLGAFAQSVAPTITYNYTGGMQTYTVPTGITHIVVNAKGGSGGLNSNEASYPDRGGYGGCITDTLVVTPGQVVNIFVGGKGADGVASAVAAGGFNGGGNGNFGGPFHLSGGGGGGASDIRTGGVAISNRVIIAGGGGGAAPYCATTSSPDIDRGGDGGGLSGETGHACSGSTGGGGATQTCCAAGGICSTCSGTSGYPGALFFGGAAGTLGALGYASAGGGGGGGYYGGGGGQWTGGGGGSNFGSATAVNVRGCNTGNGIVTITPVCTTPAITGTSSACVGASSTLSDATTGGTWSSSNANATVGSISGIVTGVSAGTTTITYVVGPCYVTNTFTINPLPTATTGADTVCAGLTTVLSSIDGPGTWTSSNTTVATVGSTTGAVHGIMAGTTIITYTLTTGCINTTTVLVDPLPATITGRDSVCVGLTTTFNDATLPGTWSSSNSAVGSIDPATGIITGVSAGTATITYTAATGACIMTKSVKVNPLPAPVTGSNAVCVGSQTTLTDAGGGTWMSGSTGIATIGSGTGIVTGIFAGTTVITYTLPSTCVTTDTILVNPLPSIIHGTTNVCVGLTTALSNDSTGGTWSSSNAVLATVGSTGIVTGVSAGTLVITYTLPTGCTAITSFTVNPLPAPISGTTNVCVSLMTTLSDGSIGGTWSSSNTAYATVGSGSGVVTGIMAGTAIITYTLPTGCIITTSVLVNPLSPITGPTEVCRFSSITLVDTTTGGTWSSSNTAIATINSATGVLTGVTAGTATITYLLPTGCPAYTVVRVDPFSNITGPTSVCTGAAITLADSVSGGTWSSSDITIATVGSASGVVTGVITGTTPATATITYTLPTGCTAYTTITVNPILPITGTTELCRTFTTTLSDAVTGGTWSSSNVSVATVDPFGVVTGVNAGTAIITYMLPTGCSAYTTVLVDPYQLITGTPTVCMGLTTLLSNSVPGGTWSSSDNTIATIGSGTGLVTGIAAGTVTITYALATGCTSYTVVTVFPLSPIIGSANVCEGMVTVLSDTTTGGVWSSSNTGVAVVGSASGVVLGLSNGTSIITYHLPTGCEAYVTLVVSPLTSITGIMNVCEGHTTNLFDATPGGTWTSGNTSVATIGSTTGVVTGILAGTAPITYTLGTGCTAYATITVNASPGPVTGMDSVCVGLTTTLSDAIGTGTWSSSSTNVSVGSTTGIVTGVVAGTAIITYTLPGNCISLDTIKINPLPAAITGSTQVCAGLTTTLGDISVGGTWSSSNTTVANIGSLSGLITAGPAGTATITYTLPTGCITTRVETVNALPSPITGLTEVCVGQTTIFSDVTGGGTWTSADVTIATAGSSSGVITGVLAGSTIITYTITSTGCIATTTVTVDSLAPITGPAAVCSLSTITLHDVITGGTWSSSSTGVATIGSTGDVTGVTAGTTVITYLLPSGCYSTRTITVHPLPGIPTGPATVCVGVTATFLDGSGGGTWISSNTVVATIGSTTGILTGVSAGTATITYKNTSTGCYNTTTVTIYDLAAIVGPTSICNGSCVTLSDPAIGGTWSSGTITVATIGSTTGLLCGILPGTSVISYTLPTGCRSTTTITVNPLPFAIAGPTVVCEGSSITLTDVTAGIGSTWSSGTTSVATIGATTVGSAVINGVSAGTSVITYTLATGCITTVTVLVNPVPSPITGTFNICQGATTTLGDITAGGTWLSSNTAVATIGSISGDMTGVSGGTATITYALLSTGCYAVASVTVNPVPAITGSNNVCFGLTTTLSESIGGGTWSSSNTSVADVGSLTGIVTGAGVGTAIITYTFTTGCSTQFAFTVNPLPAAITAGTTTVCQGQTITFTDGSGGGTWSSSNTSVATVGSLTGVITGTGGGTATITYTLPTGCLITQSVSVNPSTPITGANNVCLGFTTTLGDATGGGTWSSSNTSVANIGSLTGLVTGVGVGTSTIVYLLPTGCSASIVFTVNPLPGAISGPSTVCTGSTITLTDPPGPGTWTSSAGAIASVGFFTGVVTGNIAGSATITFTLATGCYAVKSVTVNQSPAGITGPASVCIGTTITLSDASGGGTWISNNTSIATVGSLTGVVTGIAFGVTTITYQGANGCYATKFITVNNLPSAITGPNQVCAASSITLFDGSLGGGWTSSNGFIATVVSGGPGTGIVTGVSAGVVNITYTLGTGCIATYAVTVLPQPAAVITPLGDTMICPGGYVALTANTGSGLTYQWYYSSGAPIPGATNDTYIDTLAGSYQVLVSASTGCTRLSIPIMVSINPASAAISIPAGTTTGCSNPGLDLNAIGAGSYQWELGGSPISGATAATYTATVTGVYSLIVTNSTGCSAEADTTITINASPAGILTLSGPTTFCASSSLTITGDAGTGLTYQWWSATAGAIPGATNMSYTTSTSDTYFLVESNGICSVTSANVVVTVLSLPVSTITASGPTTFCSGGSVALGAPGGAPVGTTYQWYLNGAAISGATNVAYVASATGNYKIRVTGPNGCSDTSASIYVAAVTTPIIVPLTPASFCWGGSARLSVQIVGGAGYVHYQWYMGSTLLPADTLSTFSATASGSYSVTVTIPGSCVLASLPVRVTENPLPNPLVTFDGTNFHTQSYFTTFQWYENNVPITGATHATTPAITNGNYKVSVTDTNGCQSVSDVYVLAGWTGVHNVGVPVVNAGDIKIYPNPAQNVVHIESPENVHAIITTIDGKLVIDQASAKDVDISMLADGMYMIMLYDDNGQMVKSGKLLKASN